MNEKKKKLLRLYLKDGDIPYIIVDAHITSVNIARPFTKYSMEPREYEALILHSKDYLVIDSKPYLDSGFSNYKTVKLMLEQVELAEKYFNKYYEYDEEKYQEMLLAS